MNAAPHPGAVGGARALARAELTRAILASARRQLVEVGPAALSVRAVARDLQMASSAVYRYFPSRDALLTALLVESYDQVGEVTERADREVTDRTNFPARWLAIARAIRGWALGHPHDYALLYGSPVPGYAAPEATVGPATRAVRVVVDLLADLEEAGAAPAPRPVSPAAHAALAGFRRFAARPISDELAVRGLAAWGGLIGTLTLELFGHFRNAIDDVDAYFDQAVVTLLPLAAGDVARG